MRHLNLHHLVLLAAAVVSLDACSVLSIAGGDIPCDDDAACPVSDACVDGVCVPVGEAGEGEGEGGGEGEGEGEGEGGEGEGETGEGEGEGEGERDADCLITPLRSSVEIGCPPGAFITSVEPVLMGVPGGTCDTGVGAITCPVTIASEASGCVGQGACIIRVGDVFAPAACEDLPLQLIVDWHCEASLVATAQSITTAEDTPATFTPAVRGTPGNPVTWTMDVVTGEATVTPVADQPGRFRFTPAPNGNGTMVVQMTPTRDGIVGIAAELTVTVTPVDDLPVLVSPTTPWVVPVGSDSAIDVVVVDPDDGSTVTDFTGIFSTAPAGQLTFTVTGGNVRLRWNLTGTTFTGTSAIAMRSPTMLTESGVRLPVKVLPAQPSCLAVAAQVTTPTTGVHRLVAPGPVGGGTYDAWCDMDVDGGGWTLAIKVDGAASRFGFTGVDWTNTTLSGTNNTELDDGQAKLQSFLSVPVDEVLLGFAEKVGGVTAADYAFLQLPMPSSSSLLEVFSGPDNVEVLGGPPPAAWISIHPNFRIEPGCRRVFINAVPQSAGQRVRLGLLGSDTPECLESTSYIAIGGADGGAIAGADNIDANEQPMLAALLVRSTDLRDVGDFASCAAVAAAGFKRTADYSVAGARTRCVLP